MAEAAHAETQTQHAFDTSVELGRLEPLMHFRIRTKPEGGGLSQVRTGPIFEFDVSERVTLIAGYYYTREDGGELWGTTHRFFSGGELMNVWRAVEIDWRGFLERFVLPGEEDYFRLRNRLRVSPPGVAAPYVAVEVFVDARGLRSTRYSGGVRRTFAGEFIVDIGYFFEERRTASDGRRHMVSTSFHWRNKTRRVDPDF